MSTRKRSRKQQQQQEKQEPQQPRLKVEKTTNEEGDSSPAEDPPASLLTPHTQRLLKLIQEGTSSHAKHAALHLREIAARASPLVLWDLLGRLQALLIGEITGDEDNDIVTNWSCRQHAQWAMQGVAQCLPRSDQDAFLSQIVVPCTTASTDGTEGEIKETNLWLTVQDLDMDTVLQQGRLLMSAPEHKYKNDKDALLLDRLDANAESLDDFVQKRIQLQRRILARRLGLGGIAQATGNTDEWLPDTLTSQDFRDASGSSNTTNYEETSHDTTSKTASSKKHEQREKPILKKTVRALLVMEMKHQTKNTATGSAGMAVSHQNPQQLLATELLYRMFDPLWHVRHGALLGISSLLQAWHNSKRLSGSGKDPSPQSSFGAWPQDLLARSLCNLALDRFADFSGDASVAPVRLAAAQVVAWLYHLAPSEVQAACRRTIIQLATYHGDDWEVRHGGLVAIQFLLVVVVERKAVEEFAQIAVQALCDDCDDVVAVAAQVLLSLMKRQEKMEQQDRVRIPFKDALWSALLKVESYVSSSAVPLVTLFSEWLSRHPGQLPADIEQVWSKMMRFLEFSSSAIQISTLQSLASMVDEGHIQQPCAESTQEAYRKLVLRIFDSFSEQYEYIDNAKTLHRLAKARNAAWKELVAVAPTILALESQRQPLLVEIILRLVGLEQLSPHGIVQRTGNISKAQRGVACRAVAQLVTRFDNIKIFVETVILSLLSSPWLHNCEIACLLYRSLCCESDDSIMGCRSAFRLSLQDAPPPCVLADGTQLIQRGQAMKLFDSAFVTSLQKDPSQYETSAPTIQGVKNVAEKLLPQDPIATGKPSIARMRVSALIAGAIVSDADLPPKLTPLIRALMTSLKSEAACEYVDLTCGDLVSLLQLLDDNVQVRNKVLSNICNLSKEGNEAVSKSAAACIVERLVRELPTSQSLEAFPPIIQRLSPLQSLDPSTVEKKSLQEALDLMLIVTRAVSRGSVATSHLIKSTIQSLILIACVSPDPANRSTADACVKALARADSTSTLDKSIPLLAQHLQDKTNDSFRVGACKLLHGIIEEVDMEVCPFVRYLLPIAMSLMTDPVADCAKEAAKTFADLVRVAPLVREVANVSWSLDMDDHSKSVMDHLIHGKPLPPCVIPASISSEMKKTGLNLRKYQTEGIAWLRFLQTVSLNGALCDDMGLGKTIQALVAIALSHEESKATNLAKTLVVCPSSVVGHWVSEIRKFFPNIFTPLAMLGNSKQRSKIWIDSLEDANIIVTSYSVLRSDVERLRQPLWEYCILDEGHLLKNPKTATAMAARLIRSHHRLILTGTPVQNRVNELWATFDFLMPNFLGSHPHFSKTYGNPIGKGQQPGASAHAIKTSMDKLKLLHQQVLPFILRREKGQVLKELPPKCITDMPCLMTSEQSTLYKAFCHGRDVQRSIYAFQNMLESNGEEPVKLGSNVLKTLLYLRMLCTHPMLVENDPKTDARKEPTAQLKRSGKLQLLNELLRTAGVIPDDLAAADNDSSMFYVDNALDDELEDDFSATLQDGNDSPLAKASLSATQPNTKCLIFAQFMRSLDVVEKYLFQTHMPSLRYLRLDGSVANEKRAGIVDSFNQDDSIQVLLLTTRVGGLGLNLTGASTVIFLENDYNPFADLQAMDRAHRIGQRKTVNVYRLVTQDSIEEKIMALQQAKVRMSNAIVNSENSSMYSMGTERLLDIFTFRSEDNGKKDSSTKTDVALEHLDSLMDNDDEYHSLSIEEFIKGFSVGDDKRNRVL